MVASAMTKVAQLVKISNSVGGQLSHGNGFNLIKKLTDDHTRVGGVTPLNAGECIAYGVSGTAVIESEII